MFSTKKINSILIALMISTMGFSNEKAEKYVLTLTEDQVVELIILLDDPELLEEIQKQTTAKSLPMVPVIESTI